MEPAAGGNSMVPLPAWVAELVRTVSQQHRLAWLGGKEPRIETFLGTPSEPGRTVLLQALLRTDLEFRWARGDCPLLADYLVRFPTHPRVLEAAFARAPAGVPRPVIPPPAVTVPSAPPVHPVPPAGSPAPGKMPTGISGPESKEPESDETSSPEESGPHPSGSGRGEPSDPPAKIGRFVIEAVLGQGGFGMVYRARDPNLDRLVALKVPREGVLDTKKRLGRFLREARMAATVNHPNICPVYEVGEVDGQPFLVMALIDGLPLSQVLNGKKPILPRRAVSTLLKVARALEEAHNQGVVHRDLKPANIMIDRRREPIIMDFGLARSVRLGDSGITQSGEILGSPSYMSPEQVRGELKTLGPTTDVYSLGVILYELLCRRRPFDGTVGEIFGHILYSPPEKLTVLDPTIDPRLEAICLTAMAKESCDRYPTMAAFAQALAGFLALAPATDTRQMPAES